MGIISRGENLVFILRVNYLPGGLDSANYATSKHSTWVTTDDIIPSGNSKGL